MHLVNTNVRHSLIFLMRPVVPWNPCIPLTEPLGSLFTSVNSVQCPHHQEVNSIEEIAHEHTSPVIYTTLTHQPKSLVPSVYNLPDASKHILQ